MTKEQINVAIAEYLGVSVHPMDKARGEDSKAPLHGIADYYNDLNAMHEAEKGLPPLLWNDYANRLIRLWESGNTRHAGAIFSYAWQRAEAFLKAIGKWEDS